MVQIMFQKMNGHANVVNDIDIHRDYQGIKKHVI